MLLLTILPLLAFSLFCGAVPALPNSVPAQRQQRRIMDDAEQLPEETILSAVEKTPFVSRGRRVNNHPSPTASVVPKLTSDAKIIASPTADGGDWWRMGGAQMAQPPAAMFMPPTDSVVPKMSGMAAPFQAKMAQQKHQKQQKDSFSSDALVNPAAFFLQGADLDKIAAPSCHLVGCTGPLANDGDIALEGRTGPGAGGTRQCHQTFVPLNGCWETPQGPDSYPVGMVCTICCECSAQLTAEMRRSRGWTNGYRGSKEATPFL